MGLCGLTLRGSTFRSGSRGIWADSPALRVASRPGCCARSGSYRESMHPVGRGEASGGLRFTSETWSGVGRGWKRRILEPTHASSTPGLSMRRRPIGGGGCGSPRRARWTIGTRSHLKEIPAHLRPARCGCHGCGCHVAHGRRGRGRWDPRRDKPLRADVSLGREPLQGLERT